MLTDRSPGKNGKRLKRDGGFLNYLEKNILAVSAMSLQIFFLQLPDSNFLFYHQVCTDSSENEQVFISDQFSMK
jgi:hypothetical protein